MKLLSNLELHGIKSKAANTSNRVLHWLFSETFKQSFTKFFASDEVKISRPSPQFLNQSSNLTALTLLRTWLRWQFFAQPGRRHLTKSTSKCLIATHSLMTTQTKLLPLQNSLLWAQDAKRTLIFHRAHSENYSRIGIVLITVERAISHLCGSIMRHLLHHPMQPHK
jgi:hypothetical protein